MGHVDMPLQKNTLRSVVLAWTILTTTFFWTSTMRILLKPEISSWRLFNAGGEGFSGSFWLPPLIALVALFAFYLESRRRLRTFWYPLLILWHSLITCALVYGSLQSDGQVTFGTWGISMSFIWLALPAAVFLVLSILLVIREIRGAVEIPVHPWRKINLQPLIIAAVLLPVALLFFLLGEGFNWLVKIAVASTIVQWIMLAEALGRPYKAGKQEQA